MINLLPYKEKKSIERIRNIKIVQTIVLGVTVLICIAVVLLLPTLITIDSRFSIANNQLATLEHNGSIASDVDLSTLENRSRTAHEKLAATLPLQTTAYVDLVRAVVPAGIALDRFASEDGVLLEVFGTAQNRELLQTFITTLEAQPKVDLVDSPVSNFIKNKNGSFKLTISFKTT